MKSLLSGIIVILAFQLTYSQINPEVTPKLTGHWEGAFIRENSYQKIEVEFFENEGNLLSLQVMDEWHPTFGEFVIPVSIDSTGLINMNTGVGKALMRLDANNLELNGELDGFQPAIYVHFKKIADPPKENFELVPVTIPSGNISLNGHLHAPEINPTKTAIILVGGRGCNADETAYNLYAKFLRSYGIAVLAYQKRGTGNSTGDCDKASIEDLASDVAAVYQFLKAEPNEFEKVGVLGISAGGWTMTKAAESVGLDFMISIVGPSTSVYDQQMQSMKYGAEFYKLTPSVVEHLTDYTELMFSAKTNKRGFDKMNSLLQLAEREDWRKLLESTDIPESERGIEELWVRRHSFDPAMVLRSFEKPFLGIYGQTDWIVPYRENIGLLNSYFKDRMELLTTVVAYGAEHGMEKEAKQVSLSSQHSYWHFYRISPQVRIEIAEFLRKHEIVK